MRLTDVFDSQSIAMNRTENASNKIPFLGEGFFPSRKKVGMSVKWLKTHKGLNAILMPTNSDAIPTVRSREGFKQENTDMVFFRESMHIKEEDMFEIMRAQDSNDPYVDDVLSSIYNDVDKLLDAAEIAAEAMRMSLLATDAGTPKISIGTADNMIYTYNYDPDGSYKAKHYLKLTSNDTWNNASTAKPLTDINKGTTYLKNIGVTPVYALMTSKTFGYLLENEQIKAALVTISNTPVSYIDEGTVKEVFRRKTGLTPIIYDKQYINYAGEQVGFFPDDKVTIIGDGALGDTVYGTTPEERTLMADPTADVSIVDTGVAVAVKTEAGPPVKVLTSVSQLVIPTYEGMDKTFVIDVK